MASESDQSKPAPGGCLTGELPDDVPTALKTTYLAVPGEVGKGAFARIRRIRLRQKDALAPRIEFALKTIDKRELYVRGLLGQAQREIELQLKASSHPNILGMIDFYEEPLYIHHILEFCPSYTLAHYRPPFPDNLVRTILSQLSSAVDFLHNTVHCLHRDISPGNLLIQTVTPVLLIKLADFGWAVEVSQGDNVGGVTGGFVRGKAGTESCMAPEIQREEANSFPADIYSIGRVLSYCINTKLPQISDKLQIHLNREHRSMLSVDPTQRPAAAALAAIYTEFHVSGAALAVIPGSVIYTTAGRALSSLLDSLDSDGVKKLSTLAILKQSLTNSTELKICLSLVAVTAVIPIIAKKRFAAKTKKNPPACVS
jgi:serine/threonine protein kinase